jgi:hypothetical protein
MKSILHGVINRQKRELRKQENTWVKAGGSLSHFKHIHEFKLVYDELIRCGPTGYGGEIVGCRTEVDPIWLKDEEFRKRHDRDLSKCNHDIMFWHVKWCRRVGIDPNVMVFCNRYLELWESEAVDQNRAHLCWDPENERVFLHRIKLHTYMMYLFYRGMGLRKIQKVELMLKAIAKGYWPIGYDGDTPIVLRCRESDILPPWGMTKKRKSIK